MSDDGKEIKLVEGEDYIVDDEGVWRHPETNYPINKKTGKQMRGFAANPDGINKGGRPKGSRNKSTIAKAQYALDSASEEAVAVLVEMMLDPELKPSDRRAAAVEVLKRTTKEEAKRQPEADISVQDESVEDNTPMFSPVPVAKNGTDDK